MAKSRKSIATGIPLVPLWLLAAALIHGCMSFGTKKPKTNSDAQISASSDAEDSTKDKKATTASNSEHQEVSPVPEYQGLQLAPAFGDEAQMKHYIEGVFAIFWDKNFDHLADAKFISQHLMQLRQEVIAELGMRDPPNMAAGLYYNIYIHHGDQDHLPNHWANGQGTTDDGLPFLTLPVPAHTRKDNLDHEGFHIFQYAANSPGFRYTGDSQWYIETSAQWYAAYKSPLASEIFVEAEAIRANPYLALWHSFENMRSDDSNEWLVSVHQYGMHSFLHYLTSQTPTKPMTLTAGFYQNLEVSPQQYLFAAIGGKNLRRYFADWAAHHTADMDYLSRRQYLRALAEAQHMGNPQLDFRFIAQHEAAGTYGKWQRAIGKLPRNWGYNVIEMTNNLATPLTVKFKGDRKGSDGTKAAFEVRIIVKGINGFVYETLELDKKQRGSIQLNMAPTDEVMFMIIAAVPESFSGNEEYGYQYKIKR